jgi:hypothetical protein
MKRAFVTATLLVAFICSLRTLRRPKRWRVFAR